MQQRTGVYTTEHRVELSQLTEIRLFSADQSSEYVEYTVLREVTSYSQSGGVPLFSVRLLS